MATYLDPLVAYIWDLTRVAAGCAVVAICFWVVVAAIQSVINTIRDNA